MSPLHLLLGLVVALAWGLNFVVMKIGLEQLSPFWFGTLRFVIVLLILLPWLRVTKGAMTKLFLVGICIGGLHFGFVFLGMNMASQVSAIVVVVQMNIPITLLLAHFFLGEKISLWRMTGIAVAFGGVIIITFDPAIAGEGLAIAIMLAAVTLYSIGTTLMRRMQTVSILRVQAWTAFYSVPLLLALSLWFETGQIAELVHLDALHWGMLIYTAVISSIVGYGGINYLLKHYPVAQIAPILLLVPVFATTAAVVFLDEVLSLRFLIGAGITLGGLGLIHYRDWVKNRKLPKEMLP
ncbi:DMT family transporter [Luteithermobacter gelatinilyticus]|mgnify:CR=1 FL=1|uniref:DMT family transporter n=1 Tax=Luteithermobacter gelatinilyticus TaxID=2582913 RepID=UPI001105E1ED|nr:EamA family transporter [Luteithermobacter gelatinilyticus]|tara:strand:- start:1109 stop:1993 length:885 start_codon:yes stop_codon:yes gene_type:complete